MSSGFRSDPNGLKGYLQINNQDVFEVEAGGVSSYGFSSANQLISNSDFTAQNATFNGEIHISSSQVRHSVEELTQDSGVTTLDFSGSLMKTQGPLTSDVYYETQNLSEGTKVITRIENGTDPVNVFLPSDWAIISGSTENVLESNSVGLLSVTSFGSSDTMCVAEWRSE